jgi:hypothetical protein
MVDPTYPTLVIKEVVQSRPSNDGNHILFRMENDQGEKFDLAFPHSKMTDLIYCGSVGLTRCEAKKGNAASRLPLIVSDFKIRADERLGEFVLALELFEFDGKNHPTIAFRIAPDLAMRLTEGLVTRPTIASRAAFEGSEEARRAAQKTPMQPARLPDYPARQFFTERLTDHMHDPLNKILIISSSVRIAGDAILKEQRPDQVPEGAKISTENQVSTFESNQFNTSIIVPDYGPVQTALRNQYPDRIEVEFRPGRADPTKFSVKTEKYASVMLGLFCAIFIDFHATYTKRLETHVGDDVAKWPEPWQFANVVRNAMAHGGTINYGQRKNVPTVTWHHISYGASDKGRLVVGGDFSLADILLLMFEMRDALKRVNCPTAWTL